MAWTDLQSNQAVSFSNLKNAADNGVFTAKTTIPTSNEQMTKADVNTYIYVNASDTDFSNKANNQLVVKSNLLSNLVIYSTGNPLDGSFAVIKSTDLGFSWSKVDQVTGGNTIQCVDTSNNGTYVLVGRSPSTQPGSGRFSQTSGNTWLDMTAVVPTTDGITSCAISGSGQYIVITRTADPGFNNEIIYTSSDYGSSFAATRANDSSYNLAWQASGISMSDSGQYVTIAVPDLFLGSSFRIRSTDYGATWLSAVDYGSQSYIVAGSAMSSSGQYQILGFTGQISLSSSFGATWSFVGPTGIWTDMAVSESGKYMLAMQLINSPYGGKLYRSDNYGQSWTLVSNFASTGSMKFAPNEKTAFLAIQQEYFYISNDYGATWSIQVNAPLSPVSRAYGKIAIASMAPLSGTVSYSTNSGLYPVTGSTLTTSTITITNGLSGTIYLYGSFNSGGANSGNISGDKLTSTGYSDINMSGTVSSYGQTIYSSFAWELPTGTSIVLTVTKNDSIGSGSTMRVAYSTTLGGSKTNI